MDFARSDFASVAVGLGVPGERAANEPELRCGLERALAASQTTGIDVVIAGNEYGELHRRIRG